MPNTDQLSYAPGWTLVNSAANLTFSTTAYLPLVTARGCPFYSGSGTGTVGLDHSMAGSGGATYHFAGTQPKVTLAACMWTNTPVSHSGTIDGLVIFGGDNIGNFDYANLQCVNAGAKIDRVTP